MYQFLSTRKAHSNWSEFFFSVHDNFTHFCARHGIQGCMKQTFIFFLPKSIEEMFAFRLLTTSEIDNDESRAQFTK